MANTSLSLMSLDPSTLEADLKAFMRGQDAFKDYDYDGSNMAAIIRIMAYNTWKQNFYYNAVHAESFLDSAQVRSSLLSRAKELNYVPRSARSARAQVRLTFTGTEPTYLLRKGSSFSSIVKSQGLSFTLPDTILATSSNGSFSVTTYLYEGSFIADSYVLDASDEAQRLVLTNPEVDTTSLTVVVYEDGDVDGVTYSRASTLLDLDETDRVYFLQAAETGQYEVVFGDGVVGRRPADGAVAVLDYRVTRGTAGNGAKVFSIDFEVGAGVSNVLVETLANAQAGAPIETDGSVRYYAPRHFQVQERAVSAPDYEVLLRTQFPEISAASVFGGEEADPPLYGRVLVAIDIRDVDGVPDSKKTEYRDFLKRRCGLTITPVFIEPQYTYLSVRTSVVYNVNVTTITPENLSTLVVNEVLDHVAENLDDFNAHMRYSKMVAVIDGTDPSIVGSQTVVRIYKKVAVASGGPQTIVVNMAVPLYDDKITGGAVTPTAVRAVQSESFTYSGSRVYLTDDSSGSVWVARDQGSQTVLIKKVGTVDYASGLILISSLTVDSIDGSTLKVYGRPAEQDVASGRDTILTVEPSEVQAVVTAVRE